MAASKFADELGDGIKAALKRGIKSLKTALFTSNDSHNESARNGSTYNMLLIGETGSGKTSFLNLLCNMNEVVRLGYECVMSGKRLPSFNDVTAENIEALKLQSKTNRSTHYKIQLDSGFELGVIDTPGFGDTRGLDQDKMNVKNIVEKVNAVTYIHCICLVLNGRQARLTSQLKYVVSEISAILPKSCVYNLILVLTNTSIISQSPLARSRSELEQYLGAEIPKQNLFCIDNPFCILEGMIKDGIDIDDEYLKNEFQRTARAFESMFNLLTKFELMYTSPFYTLHVMKEAIEKQTAELFLAVQNKADVEKQIATTKQEIDKAVEAKALNQDFCYSVKTWVTVKTERHNTLCSICNSNCHIKCDLPRSINSEPLRNCTCMNKDTDPSCRKCQHKYTAHMHNEFEYKQIEKSVCDDAKITAFNKANEDLESLSSFLKENLD